MLDMPREPIISGNFKGMAVIQTFYNNNINYCTSISKWFDTDRELLNSMMFTCKVTKYIETESDGNVIKMYDEKKLQVINTYLYNKVHGIYLNENLTGPVECLNLIDYINESDEIIQSDEMFDFVERFSEKSERKSFGRSSFVSVLSENTDDDINDGIFLIGDLVY